ncbi:FAD-dependent oxidoreductase [Nonomuraea sediminis]|uniref:FAD-dependent oxidoreductase n=1 Tax=Nonomuraea sediminis TaxID=2835864 RepID=UPI001BDD88D6|nr:cyclic nucleotide-binding domain-containing thioredoxin-disulfide reductase [Nonomuraea sediminis]
MATDDRLISLVGRSPVLDPSQLDVLRGYGSERDVAAGDVLFADGDETYDLIVLLAGTADIVQGYGEPGEAVVAGYGPSEFLGEIGMLTGQRAFLSAVATSTGRILAVPVAQLRRIMAQEPGLSDLILRTFLLRHSILMTRSTGLTLIGSRFDHDTRRLLEVLARNRLVWNWLDLEESPEAEQILQGLDVPIADLPIIIVPGGPVLRNPGSRALLDALAISGDTGAYPPGVCDLLVVGGGPAGLAASVFGASEGMATTLAEDTALGGQAGTSTRIENYLGFPAGVSGEELATRGTLQAQKFGVRIKQAAKATSLSFQDGAHQVTFDDGEVISARSVIIATGARYNRLPLDRLQEFEGVGVYYAATQAEAQACESGPVAIVGGGNSAGQAALFLSRSCAEVHVIIRRDALDATMSRYLVDRIERHPRIVVWPFTQVTALTGTNRLEAVRLRREGKPDAEELAVAGLFVFIGAKPGTDWLAGQLATDRNGFLLTGSDIPAARLEREGQPPLYLETSRPGIFAVGDVRSGSVKRVAAAIGEGSVAVRLAFERLQSAGQGDLLGLAVPGV